MKDSRKLITMFWAIFVHFSNQSILCVLFNKAIHMKFAPLNSFKRIMNRRLTLFLIVTAALAGMAVSCKDKNKKAYCEENPSQCQSVLAAKDFFLFKEGSWWVYEEETSHERDSVYVTEYYDSGGYDFDLQTHSTLEDYNYHYWPIYIGGNNCSSNLPIQSKCLFIKRSKSKPGDFVDEGYCFFVNYRIGASLGSFNTVYENNKIYVTEIHDYYELGNMNFERTIKIHELNTFMEGRQPTNHYFSKGVGLVRKELLDSNQVWNLVSYHIEE